MGVTRVVIFVFLMGFKVFYRTGIVRDRLSGDFPHWHHKTDFLTFPRILTVSVTPGTTIQPQDRRHGILL
jgi:hypothetical protein